MSAPSTFDLEQFDDDFKPSEGFEDDPSFLPDGQYKFAILGAARDMDAKGKQIAQIRLQVLGGEFDGSKVNWTTWLTSKAGINLFGNELKKLGLDSDQWNKAHGRAFSKEIDPGLAKLRGMHFLGKKSKSPKKDGNGKATGEFFHNINVVRKLDETGIPGVPNQPNDQPGPDPVDDPFGADPDTPF